MIKLPDPSSQWHVNFIKVSNDTFWATILYIHYTHPPFITLIFTNHCICITWVRGRHWTCWQIEIAYIFAWSLFFYLNKTELPRSLKCRPTWLHVNLIKLIKCIESDTDTVSVTLYLFWKCVCGTMAGISSTFSTPITGHSECLISVGLYAAKLSVLCLCEYGHWKKGSWVV